LTQINAAAPPPRQGAAMLSYEDCVALARLTADEAVAIRAHADRPDVVAFDAARYVLASPDGRAELNEFIRDDINTAIEAGDVVEAARLKLVVKRFLEARGRAAAPAGR
jgi:hypothetical protein